ncbi:MAG: glutamate--cysteine ligase [Myxococcales bacterium]|nr:glutamate--cysteine ligase [Myxococcales bacterium]
MSHRLTIADLVQSYHTHHAPRGRWLIGGEYERAVVRGDGRAVGYHDPNGIRWILEQLNRRLGWKEKCEGPHLVELAGEGASITLEPGGQVELSGAPFRRLGDLAAEVRRNRGLLYELAEGHDLHWTACGLTPYAKIDEIAFVPKGRYAMMRDFLPAHGDLAHWMMKGTCCVQVNLDFDSEEDCARKFHTSLDLAPLNMALFANSPLAEGRDTGWLSYRGHVWSRVDPRRTGFPIEVRDAYSHESWINYLLDAPMMFVRRDGGFFPSGGATFRQWMSDGLQGSFPTAADWAAHQTTVFPEVRVKRTLEIRSADAVPVDLAIAFCALWAGCLYGALEDTRRFGVAFGAASGTGREAGFALAAREGLAGGWGGRSLADWGAELSGLARAGLRAIGEDEALLDPLEAQIATGRSPGAALLSAFQQDPSPANVLRAAAY